jgi:hypothetical protein
MLRLTGRSIVAARSNTLRMPDASIRCIRSAIHFSLTDISCVKPDHAEIMPESNLFPTQSSRLPPAPRIKTFSAEEHSHPFTRVSIPLSELPVRHLRRQSQISRCFLPECTCRPDDVVIRKNSQKRHSCEKPLRRVVLVAGDDIPQQLMPPCCGTPCCC